MKKSYKIATVLGAILLLASMAFAWGGVSSRFNLVPEDGFGIYDLGGGFRAASGAVSAHYSHTLNSYGWQNRYAQLNVDSCHLTISANNMPDVGDAFMYEAWAIDDETGYELSLGRFKSTQKYGNARYSYKSACTWGAYDSFKITVEPFVDDDPTASDDVVMTGIWS